MERGSELAIDTLDEEDYPESPPPDGVSKSGPNGARKNGRAAAKWKMHDTIDPPSDGLVLIIGGRYAVTEEG